MSAGRSRSRPAAILPAVAIVAAIVAATALSLGPACPMALAGTARAPVAPPLVSADAQAEPEETGSAGPQVDPLVANGLGSPTCGSPTALELDAASRRDCETSGFLASAAPTQDYGLDVHVDTGLLGLGYGGLLSVVQGMFVSPLWMTLVWAVHALLVMLEWSLSLNLTQAGLADGLPALLSGSLTSLTRPWLPLALSATAVIAAYHGLVRRRVAQTLGETLLTIAMMAVGIWLILDPLGTVGTLARWSGQAALGTLAVAARGTPLEPGRTLGESFAALFAGVIEAPWCYLEFGDVAWCRDPSRLEPALRAAALRIAAHESAQAGCAHGCGSSISARALAASARLLREAQTNGAIFLALPPNGPERNSIDDTGSLLRAICASSEATDCQGPAAAQAEFRTNGATWSRVGGLLLICLGLSGMLLLVGLLAMRLLLSALLGVLYLLLAPALVIAPACGEHGRTLFGAWLGRLLGAVLSKLTYAFLLGAVLAVYGLLESMNGIGWWTRWLLLSTLWWGAFTRRRAIPSLPSPLAQARRPRDLRPVQSARQVRQTIRAQRARRDARLAKSSSDAPAAVVPRPGRATVRPVPLMDDLAQRCLDVQRRDPGCRQAPALVRLARDRIQAAEQQLLRIRKGYRRADETYDQRSWRRLKAREGIVAERLRQDQELVLRLGSEDAPGQHPQTHGLAWSRYLDEQAATPRGTGPGGRDYPGLAGVAGLDRGTYEELAGARRLAARQEIDRALAARREERADLGVGAPPRQQLPRQPRGPRRPAWEESEVFNDIRECLEGRKQQLGIGKP